jgi:hypothetical protein
MYGELGIRYAVDRLRYVYLGMPSTKRQLHYA